MGHSPPPLSQFCHYGSSSSQSQWSSLELLRTPWLQLVLWRLVWHWSWLSCPLRRLHRHSSRSTHMTNLLTLVMMKMSNRTIGSSRSSGYRDPADHNSLPAGARCNAPAQQASPARPGLRPGQPGVQLGSARGCWRHQLPISSL